MFDWKNVTVDDRELLNCYLRNTPYQNCEYAFINIFLWSKVSGAKYCIEDGCLVLRYEFAQHHPRYLLPICGNTPQVIEKLKKYAHDETGVLEFTGVTEPAKDYLESVMPGVFEFTAHRSSADYLYLRDDLAQLKGKKYHSKRNFANRFKSTYIYEYKRMDKKIAEDCLEMHKKWCEINASEGDMGYLLQAETQGVVTILEHFDQLNLIGGAIYVDGNVVAFTFGQPINPTTFDVSVEKAYYDMPGAYAAINQLFVENECQGYKYINREDDAGIEGLRKAKLSYHPVKILEKYIARCEA